MKYWYSYKLFFLKKTNRLDFNSMRQLGIPKKIIGKVILDEVINDFRLKKNLSSHKYKYLIEQNEDLAEIRAHLNSKETSIVG